MKTERGQILVGVIVVMVVLAVIIPAMVLYVQNEARWSMKQQRNMSAFELADAAIDRGFRKISGSTTTWGDLQNGIVPVGYNFDTAYADLGSGTYAVSITSGPQSQQATIIGVGRDGGKKEVRAIKAVYANSPLSNTAVRAGSGVTIDGTNTTVHWGAIISGKSITDPKPFPQKWSAGAVNGSPNDGFNCDKPNCWEWHSYQTQLPPAPKFDLPAYELQAKIDGSSFPVSQEWPGPPCKSDDTSCDTGKTYYINGDLDVKSAGIYIRGNLIITGNLNLPNGRSGQGAPTVPLPTKAWLQYGNAWSQYASPTCGGATWSDPSAPASFPGLNSSYLSNPAINVNFSSCGTGKVVVNGFTYVGGNLTQGGGGGQSVFVGAIYVKGTVNITTNNLYIYYTEAAGASIKTTSIILSRQSWQDLPSQGWPVP